MPVIKKILIIQTAFLGDVVLATGVAEKLHQHYPEADMDFLLRKGNEGLLQGHPFLRNIFIWNKKEGKYRELLRLLKSIRREKYDLVVNLQRFGASGFLTAFSRAGKTLGFSKNPFSFLFTQSFPHDIGKKGDQQYRHEIERNHALIAGLTDAAAAPPRLYPAATDRQMAAQYASVPFVTLSPASVWFTKQWPKHKWLELIQGIDPDIRIYLLGGKGDQALCEEIAQDSGGRATVLAGKFSLLQTAALMQQALMNYTNDSAPMHLASAMNAPVTAIFCSTIPEFGFGPLSDQSHIWEEKIGLTCRPCGLHGHKSCPEGHFLCAEKIIAEQIPAIKT